MYVNTGARLTSVTATTRGAVACPGFLDLLDRLVQRQQ
jgi:hypothetical protein